MFEETMVMSMDTTTDQAIGSPMDESTLSIRHQESADEELNMDEQSKASGQTVVDVVRNQQQQQLSHSHHCQTSQRDKSPHEHETKTNQAEMPAAMVLSRESSLNDDDEGDDCKLMMHVDPEAMTSIEQKSNEMKHKFEDRDDLDTKDPLLARMRDIVEGNQHTSITQCQHHQHHHYQQQQQQPKSSSGDSLNNQATENNSKASADSGQQKRSRQTRHCGRHHHHHYHHHHRQSLGTNIGGGGGQTAPTGHHHHHHHHHRPVAHQHAHRHHHHHHHHQHDHHLQQIDTGGPQTSVGDVSGGGSGKRTSSQRPLGESESCKHQAAESSFSQTTETSKQAGESKSSNSSVSSAPIEQHQPQQETIMSNKSSSDPKAINEKHDELERCMHHPTCHHHHHANPPDTALHPPPHHHHHHHHCHGRHHHHRNHKKRLIQDAGDDQPIQQADNQPASISQQEQLGDLAGFETQDKQQEMVDNMSPRDSIGRAPLQEIGSQTSNVPTATGFCPYHDHHCTGHPSRGAIVKLHPHHHHHHQHSETTAKKEISAGEQQQHRGHHYHHHHRHHHHGQHHHKPRARKHKSSSNTNIDEQTLKEQSTDFEPSLIDKNSSNRDKQNQHEDDINKVEANASAVSDTCDQYNSKSSERQQIDLENKMSLDNNDESQLPEQTNRRASMGKASSEVVNMEISPNNDNKQSKMGGLADGPEESVNSLAVDSNFIASIDISSRQPTNSSTNKQLLSNSNEKRNHQQHAEDSDFNTQGASGNDTAKNNSVHEFTRNPEGDSMKQTSGKTDRLVGQVSRENSRKEILSGSGAGASKQQDQQQLIECSSIQQDQQSSQPKQIIESTVSPDRRCRLCWCCCCPCSGLSNRNNPSKAEMKQNVIEAPSSTANKCQALSNIPLEKIRSWAESFDRLMKCPDGRRIFQDFLRCEYSEENILFWIACEELKHEKDAKSIATKARDIYEDYISILSAKEVSLDSRVRDIINNNIKKPTSNIFDEAQLQIYTLMHRDSYPRFINSPMYKKLAQIQTSSSRKGST